MRPNNGRLWDTVCDGKIEIRSLTEDKLEESLDVLEQSFFRYEPICVALEINEPENVRSRDKLREFARLIALDGLSLIAVEKSTEKLVAVAMNKLKFIPLPLEPITLFEITHQYYHAPVRSYINFLDTIDETFDVFENLNLDCFCEIRFLATLPQWWHRGIAKALTTYTIELTKELKQGQGVEEINEMLRHRRPQAVKAFFTSFYSQKIRQAEGFKVVYYTSYNRFGFNRRIGWLEKGCEYAVYFL